MTWAGGVSFPEPCGCSDAAGPDVHRPDRPYPPGMSFDVFFQRFRHGDAEPGGGAVMRSVLAPHVAREDPAESFSHVVFGDGAADVYLSEDSMMANHIAGEQPWDLLVEGARAAGWVVMPVGCPVLITCESDRAHLPDSLGVEAVLVLTGQDARRVISER